MINFQPQPTRLRFKVDDYYKMIELEMLEDYEKAAIIKRELIQKMPVANCHVACVEKLNEALNDELGKSILIIIDEFNR